MLSMFQRPYAIITGSNTGFTTVKNLVKSYSSMIPLTKDLLLQWKPLHVIALGQTEADNINWMITVTNLFISDLL